ncbi:hypothetical protein K8O96_16440 [Clostridium sporogenes]|nr:hypothetical protein [Clostridium sporogenes]UAL59647.1 hypothetical protein K8O96_16440 [Clostridium sporogenes]
MKLLLYRGCQITIPRKLILITNLETKRLYFKTNLIMYLSNGGDLNPEG